MTTARMVTAIAAAGLIAAAITAATATAGGPGGTVESPNDISAAVGTGEFEGALVGFYATGPTNDAASAAVLAQCQNAGGIECTTDEVTNNLCIVSAADDVSDVVAGGGGPTVQAAFDDARNRAAANNTPFGPEAAIVISACP